MARIKYAGIYDSVPTEGQLIGLRTRFIALQGSPVHFKTLHPFSPQKKTVTSLRFVRDLQMTLSRDSWITFTGGEPFQQEQQIVWIAEKLHSNGYRKLNVETSGVVIPDKKSAIDIFNCDAFFSLNPVMPSEGRRYNFRTLFESFAFWNETIYVPYRLQCQFAIRSEEDICAVEKLFSSQTTDSHCFINVQTKKHDTILRCFELIEKFPHIRMIA